ncbi:phage tail sheath protein [Deinococcus sp. 23YEL01]|uniref:phage tail sheath protein n=1 Tax=Deinococcus sp. 23YEL01 TaxID=2745871 RepID=UPI001E3EF6FC|nr:phage tail sheath protein [Deinococcus sp. 23YEL01]MCD0168076.1 phage tail sheath protein [Deinococcus sp. 23YEL01]
MSTGKFATQIGGAAVTVPGVYTVVDKSAMVAPRGVPSRALAIVASARGGVVGGVTRVMAGDETRVLRGGVGAQMARAAFKHGMTEVFFVRVDQAQSASLDLGSGILFAVNPGRASSALQAKTAPNAQRPDAYDLYLKDASGAEQDEEYRMLGPMLDIRYTGTGNQPTGSTSKNQTGTVTLTLSATGDPAAALTVDTASLPTVAELVEAINRSAAWTATPVGNPNMPSDVIRGNPVLFTDELGTLYGGAEQLSFVLFANKSNIAMFGLTGGQEFDVRITGSYEFLQNGSDGPVPAATDYINALRLLEQMPVIGIALGSGDPVAVAALASHIDSQSGVKARRERFGSCGVAPQSTKGQFIGASLELASLYAEFDRLVVAGNVAFDNDVQTGALIPQHGAVLGAAALALKVSTRPEEPVTNKRVKFNKFQYAFNTEELEDLIEGGVMPANYDNEQGANIIVQGITTYTADNNVASRKLAAVDSLDYLNRKIRQRITSLSIGKIADEARVKAILQSVKNLLQEEVRGSRNPNGILTPGIDPDTNQPVAAYRNLTAVFDGADLVGVDFDANLVGEIAIVRVRPRITPVRIEARA